MLHPVILVGGSGTRLWPSSRKAYPKQFIKLFGKESLYQATLKRFSGEAFASPLVMTGDEFRFMATDQATDIGLTDARVVVEPQPRDTAAAVLSAALMLEKDPEAMMLVLPSDHVMTDLPAFFEAIKIGEEAASSSGALVTFGVTPERPETGYGYLELSDEPKVGKAIPLVSFREKPDLETAQQMIADGSFLWNAGIFLFRVADVIKAFEAYAPDLLTPCRDAIAQGDEDLTFFRLGAKAYEQARKVSFDYAVMEHAEKVAAVPLGGGWSDLGAWDALWQISDQDTVGVAYSGAVTSIDCKDSYFRSEDDGMHLVGLGLDGIIAVAMRDAVLVADKSRAQDVKTVVEALRLAEVEQADHYPRYHRPWGWYESLGTGARFQVKRIMVKPGGVLSLQSHMHRSEHWIVVEGTAEVTIGEETKLVTENESVYIPLGAVHRMANHGRMPMYLIEVQTGSYLGEDDIKRYEDIYHRA